MIRVVRYSTSTACCRQRSMRAHGGGWRATGLAFHGVPSGHEFNSFVLGLYNVAGPGQPLGDDLIERAKSIASPLSIMILSRSPARCARRQCSPPNASPR